MSECPNGGSGGLTDLSSSISIGKLHVSGPGVGLGYLANSSETMSRFVVRPLDYRNKDGDGDGDKKDRIGQQGDDSAVFFGTGDLAFISDKGVLFVVGRAPSDDNGAGCGFRGGFSSTTGKINGAYSRFDVCVYVTNGCFRDQRISRIVTSTQSVTPSFSLSLSLCVCICFLEPRQVSPYT